MPFYFSFFTIFHCNFKKKILPKNLFSRHKKALFAQKIYFPKITSPAQKVALFTQKFIFPKKNFPKNYPKM